MTGRLEVGQHFPDGYILVISSCTFYFNSCLQTSEKKNEDDSNTITQAQSCAHAIAIEAEKEKEAGDYCSPGRP